MLCGRCTVHPKLRPAGLRLLPTTAGAPARIPSTLAPEARLPGCDLRFPCCPQSTLSDLCSSSLSSLQCRRDDTTVKRQDRDRARPDCGHGPFIAPVFVLVFSVADYAEKDHPNDGFTA